MSKWQFPESKPTSEAPQYENYSADKVWIFHTKESEQRLKDNEKELISLLNISFDRPDTFSCAEAKRDAKILASRTNEKFTGAVFRQVYARDGFIFAMTENLGIIIDAQAFNCDVQELEGYQSFAVFAFMRADIGDKLHQTAGD